MSLTENVGTELADLRVYLDAVFGAPAAGVLIVGTGRDRNHAETAFNWPEERRQAEAEILREASLTDVYVCPYLMRTPKRSKGYAVTRQLVHADVDGGLDAGKVRALGGFAFAVASGTPGHGHVYVALNRPVSLEQHTALCRALGRHFGNADAKISDNDLLRPPGTLNHKPNDGGPQPVSWLVYPAGTVDPEVLAHVLGISLAQWAVAGHANGHGGGGPGGAGEPFDLTEYPSVQAALARNTGDRSEDTMAVVAACYDAKLTLAQTRLAVSRNVDLAQRLRERHDDDVRVCWDKIDDDRRKQVKFTGADGPLAAGAKLFDPFVGQAHDFDSQVRFQMDRLRVTREAKRRLDDEERPPTDLPEFKPLNVLLAEPDEPTRWLIDEVAPTGSRIMLSAQYKSGKTTCRDNLVRSLVDLDPFLDHFPVCVTPRRVAVLDNELGQNMMRRWLASQGIQNTSAVSVVSLRGKVGAFDLLDDRCRAEWASRFRDLGIDFLVFDCLRPVLDALGLDENHDAGKFLTAFDALLCEAAIPDAAIIHHMGHANERARGDSRLQDWPDAIWRLVRESEEPDSARFFSAYGRDVDVPEGRLAFDPATRRLSYAAGSRADAKTEAAMRAVIDLLSDDARDGGAGMSGRQIEAKLSDSEHTQKSVRDGIKLAIGVALVTVSEGAKNAGIHRIAHPCDECGRPVVSGDSRHRECRL
jgi:hypothetical protein